MNLFTTINSYIRRNESKTYADLINNTTKEDIIKRGLNSEELTYFQMIKENNLNRLYDLCGNNINIELNVNNQKQYVSGIGKVQQIM